MKLARYLAIGAALAALFAAGAAYAQPARSLQQSEPGAGNAGYPPGSTPFVQNFDGANAGAGTALTVTPPNGQHAYICGFEVGGLGATSPTSVEFHFGTLVGPGGLLFYQYTYPSGAAAVATPVTRSFFPSCLRSLNTGAAVGISNLPGAAGNTTTYMQMWGYFE